MSSDIFSKESSIAEKSSFRGLGISPQTKGRENKSRPNMIKNFLKGKPYPMQKTMLKPENNPLRVSDKERVAKEGFKGISQSVPYKAEMEEKFGVSFDGVKTHTGMEAKNAAKELGAEAYTYGKEIAFRRQTPSKETVAHELTHVVQQSSTHSEVQEKSKGTASDSELEKEAEEKSKDLSQPSVLKSEDKKVQLTGYRLDEPLPEGAETPEHTLYRGPTTQRQYSVKQYIDMWEKSHGRKMSDAEKKTLARGCIGITAVEINAVNPPLDNAYSTFEKAYAVMKEWNAFVEANKNKDAGNGLKIGDYKAVLFAKLFWSNQSYDPEKRKKPDEKAFRPDPKTGKVDMSGYRYLAQPGYVNFDYGFWDESTQSFWHANHAEPGMKVYQSTKEKFAAGYIDFDRIVYCVAWARNYKPQDAARNN